MPDPNATYSPAAPTIIRMHFSRPGPRAWVRIESAATDATVVLNGHRVGRHVGAWTAFEFEVSDQLRDKNELEIHCEDRFHVTQGFLPVIGVRWTGISPRYEICESEESQPAVRICTSPSPPTVAAVQRSAANGTQLLVDGRPFRVRGILHWGYYPELGNPWPSESQMRREITELKALGFNLIKFCLWIPPRRYYELCDELGMCVWQEYPVWNAPLRGHGTPQFHQALSASGAALPTNDQILAEFRDFFLQDRRFPCIILRSMTCENDHVSPQMSRALVDLAHELIPGCLALDNSGWLCNEQTGDFHDEHPYVHNAQWVYYAGRMQGRLTKPLLLGEAMVADTLNAMIADDEATRHDHGAPHSAAESLVRSMAAALGVRRFQIETLAREMPDAGYVVCGLRDLEKTPLGIYTHDGRLKYAASDWSWHTQSESQAQARGYLHERTETRVGDLLRAGDDPRTNAHALALGARIHDDAIQPPLGGIIGPRKNFWKCRDNTWWSPIVRVLDPQLPVELIEREAAFGLLSGRVLTHAEGTRVLVEQIDVHSGEVKRNPLVIEFRSAGRRRIVSAFRHDTLVGHTLWQALRDRMDRPSSTPPPEIGPISGMSIVLEDWEMRIDGESWEVHRPAPDFDIHQLPCDGWVAVKCDTPLVNAGRTSFEGWATFRTRFEHAGGSTALRCESVADYYELYLDCVPVASVGPKHGTWDGARDTPRTFDLDLSPGRHEIVLRVRDWRAAGGLVGPIYLATDLNERIF
jgi:hypothetical protein